MLSHVRKLGRQMALISFPLKKKKKKYFCISVILTARKLSLFIIMSYHYRVPTQVLKVLKRS